MLLPASNWHVQADCNQLAGVCDLLPRIASTSSTIAWNSMLCADRAKGWSASLPRSGSLPQTGHYCLEAADQLFRNPAGPENNCRQARHGLKRAMPLERWDELTGKALHRASSFRLRAWDIRRCPHFRSATRSWQSAPQYPDF